MIDFKEFYNDFQYIKNANGVFAVNSATMNIFTMNLYSVDITQLLNGNNKVENVLSMRLYPFEIPDDFLEHDEEWTPLSSIPIGKTNVNCINYKVHNNMADNFAKVIMAGDNDETFEGYEIPFNDIKYLNSPQFRQLYVYLPFVGLVKLNNERFYSEGATIKVIYLINFDSGELTYYLLEHNDILETHTEKVSIEIPFNKTNKEDILRNKLLNSLSAGVTTALSVASGNPAIMASAAMNDLKTIAQNSATPISFNPTRASGPFEKFMVESNAILLFEINKQIDVDDIDEYKRINGMPSNASVTLEDLAGEYIITSQFHLDNFDNATRQEVDEIESLLKSGVIM